MSMEYANSPIDGSRSLPIIDIAHQIYHSTHYIAAPGCIHSSLNRYVEFCMWEDHGFNVYEHAEQVMVKMKISLLCYF